MSGSIFISYRRFDAGGHAGRLHDRLAQWFDADALFFDNEHIQPGDHFPQRLADAIDGAKVVLVLIGPDWLSEINRRAALPETDFVRTEVERALQRRDGPNGPKVIPVLLGVAAPPSSADLHQTLHAGIGPLLALDFHAFQGKNTDWNHQFLRLRDLIAQVPGVPTPSFRVAELGLDRADENPMLVRSRPPFVVDDFRNRTAQCQRLRELVKAPTPLCVVVSGRPGIGKTALMSQFLLGLEAEPAARVEFVYFSAAGAVPISEDLLRAHLGLPPSKQMPAGAALPAALAAGRTRRLVVVIDQAEVLLDAAGTWRAVGIQDLLRSIQLLPDAMLVLATRMVPAAGVLAGYRIEHVSIDDGLPPADAREVLLAADFDRRLGLREDSQAVDDIVGQVAGNPRMLELAMAVLQEDPLLRPAELARSLASHSDVVLALLRDSYANIGASEKAVLLCLAVAAMPVPLPLLQACLPAVEAQPAVRSLSMRHLVRVDRATQSVHIPPLDAEYLLSSAWPAEDVRHCHVVLAQQAEALLHAGYFSGRQEDVWRLKVVEHLLFGAEFAKAAEALEASQQAGLEAHGLYDQLICLHERLAGQEADGLGRHGAALLRLLTLSGRKEKTAVLLQQLMALGSPAPGDEAARCRLALEMGSALRDLDRPRQGLHELHIAARSAEPDIAARALSAIGQMLRRRGDLLWAWRALAQALQRLDGAGEKTRAVSGARALDLHQQALIARFRGCAEEAHALLNEAIRESEAAQDSGGLAYRYSLRAALGSDELALRDAIGWLSSAIAIYEEIGDDWGKAAALYALAQLQSDLGDGPTALELATRARVFALSSGNTRVEGVLDGLALTLARRASAPALATRSAAERAAARLDAAGMRWYARRIRYELALDRCLSGEGPIEAPLALLPTVGPARTLAGMPAGEVARVLLRPLASRLAVDASEGAGMARDSQTLCRLLAAPAGGAAAR